MDEDIGWSPPERHDGIGWIVLSGLVLPVGWIVWLYLAFDAALRSEVTRPTLAAQTVGDGIITFICAGTPLAGAILLLLRRRRDRSVTMVGPVACIVFALLGFGTVGTATVVLAGEWANDVHRRAQPLTPLETRLTPAQAEQDLSAVGERAVRALGAEVSDGEANPYTRECVLSNLHRGTEYIWQWDDTPEPDDEQGPDAGASARSLSAAEVDRRTAAAQDVLVDAGLGKANLDGDTVRLIGNGWLSESTISVSERSSLVTVETTCLAGGPGDG
jgi:hypothetical protein